MSFPTFEERKRRLYATWTREAAAPLTVDVIRRRLREVARYLGAQYPVAWPVTLRIERGAKQTDGKYLSGESWRFGSRAYIRVNPDCPRMSTLIDTLVHEWAHLRTAKHVKVERLNLDLDHFPEWGVAYAEIYSDFFDHDEDPEYLGGAWEASRGY